MFSKCSLVLAQGTGLEHQRRVWCLFRKKPQLNAMRTRFTAISNSICIKVEFKAIIRLLGRCKCKQAVWAFSAIFSHRRCHFGSVLFLPSSQFLFYFFFIYSCIFTSAPKCLHTIFVIWTLEGRWMVGERTRRRQPCSTALHVITK